MSDSDCDPAPRDAGPRANRLASEKSPYLLQHAFNPVDWYPWGEEAFERSRAEDRPIFLSIGYATCHWCHVMEHESFEDPDVAALLNRDFISIKVDREERPDIDGVYMTVCQLMTGHGGWPLTIVMTPDKQPFFAGTYFPRESVAGRLGMLELLPRLVGLWRERRTDVEAAGASALQAVREVETRGVGSADGALGEETLRRGFGDLLARFDPHQGGFSRAPKFPAPHQLLFLLRWSHRTGDPRGVEMVEKTLVSMRRGGIFDHVGYGFHRYSTDARWLVPHFEKMLYDQALLAMAYTELWQITRDDAHRRVALEIFEYVARDLTDPGGAFHSAEDADSEGREGAFYVWTRDELDEVVGAALGEDAARLARRAFQVETRGNFADEASGLRTGENILHLRETPAQIAAAVGEEAGDIEGRLEEIRRLLFEARATRVRPLLDDKILTDWNGLMIAAMAAGGRAFGEEPLVAGAAGAADFILDRLRDEDGRLLHRHREGESAIAAGAADHACLIWGLIELYGATWAPRWLREARGLLDDLLERFWDPERHGVFNVDAEQTDVPVRQKEVYDGATPSANAAAWYVLLRLGRLTGDPGLLDRAESLGRALAGPVGGAPSAHTMSLVALDLALGPSREVVVSGNPAAADTQRMLAALTDRYGPRTAVLFKPAAAEGDGDAASAAAAELEEVAPFTRAYGARDGAATAYVCSGFTCQRPTTDVAEMLNQLS
ncbi:thioredoxin domain-containing protein [Candidatus Palauibacter sp.]|uniref:thioredoxin domain-containing protein n=1 Tax=Candidatus Palauibacter sp. TaxID=3101350 RepID=UPI003B01EF76